MLLLVSMVLFWTQSAFAQQFKITSYQNSNELAFDEINGMAQDRYGFIWLATDEGLKYFDGVSFSLYTDGQVTVLLKKRDGSLLAGGDFGLTEITPVVGEANAKTTIVKYSEIETDTTVGLPNSILETVNGKLWLAEKGKVVNVLESGLKKYKLNDQTRGGDKLKLAEDQYKRLWAYSDNGLMYYLDNGGDTFEKFDLPAGINGVRYIFQIQINRFWVGANDGIYELTINENGQLGYLNKINDDHLGVTSVEGKSDENLLYIGTRGKGLFKAVKNQDGTWQFDKVYYKQSQQKLEKLPFINVKYIFQSDAKELWVGNNTGLHLLKMAFFQNMASLPYYSTYSIVETKSNAVYIGMGELFRLKKMNGFYRKETLPMLEGKFISSISASEKGLWVGDVNGKVNLIQGGEVVSSFDFGDRGGSAFYMFEDTRQNNWVCQAPADKPTFGLIKIDNEGNSQHYESDKGLEGRVLVIKEARDGTLYGGGIGTGNYLYRYSKEADEFINISGNLPFRVESALEVHDLQVDESGSILMATSHGFLRQNDRGVFRVSLGDFTDKEFRSIALSLDGAVWLSTASDGLIYFKNGEHVCFGSTTGLPSEIMGFRSLHIDQNDFLWVGTSQGAVRSWRPNPVPNITPRPVVKSLSVNKKIVDTSIAKPKFKFGSSLSLNYQSASFPASNLEYQTRVLGFSLDWSQETDAYTFNISNLPDGDYVFQVRARQKGGYAWSEPLNYPFGIKVVWYKSVWVYVLYVVLLVLVMYIFIIVKSKKLKVENANLEELVKNRTSEILKQKEELAVQNETILNERAKLETAKKIIERKNVELRDINFQLEAKVRDRTDELQKTCKELDFINKELDQFIYHSAHDLRGPICTLLGLSHLALMGLEWEEVKVYLKKIQFSGMRMNNILLKMIEAHEVKTSKQIKVCVVDLAECIDQVLEEVIKTEKAKGVKVDVSVEGEVKITTDANFLKILLKNVITNAVWYHDSRKKKRAVEVKAYIHGDSRLRLSVADNGIGMSDDVKSKAFDMFFRGTELSDGSGIGMYEAKIIVKRLKGEILISSTEGEGTEVAIILPNLEIPENPQ